MIRVDTPHTTVNSWWTLRGDPPPTHRTERLSRMIVKLGLKQPRPLAVGPVLARLHGGLGLVWPYGGDVWLVFR
jgi:hypothetical protein